MLTTLILWGLLGLLGQGVRAIIGLQSAGLLQPGPPTQQTQFSASYLLMSLFIGFIAGIVAGFAMSLDPHAEVTDSKTLLALVAAGYAGADFIENAFSKALPGVAGAQPRAAAANGGPGAANAAPKPLTPAAPNAPAAPQAPPAPPPGDTGGVTQFPTLEAALRTVAPHASETTWLPGLTAAFIKFDLKTNRRVAAAIGQFLVEAGAAFQELTENLTYTHAARLVAVYPREFPTQAAAEPYLNQPEALANLVYANRLGNGDTASGDGYRFRGRGLIQLTGRSEYAEFGATVGKSAEDAAAYCESPEGAAVSGCWYLASRGCLVLADTWSISKITLKVNGQGMQGNAQRIQYANDMLKALGG
jgi:predicted chitinase